MRLRTLILSLGAIGALAACTDTGGYRDYPTATSAYGTRSGYTADDRYGTAACNPGNATPGERATVLHQDRPGGTDCTPSSARSSRRLY